MTSIYDRAAETVMEKLEAQQGRKWAIREHTSMRGFLNYTALRTAAEAEAARLFGADEIKRYLFMMGAMTARKDVCITLAFAAA